MATAISVIRPTSAPRLPASPAQYDQQFNDQLLNILRLYFSQIDNLSTALLVPTVYTVAALPSASTLGAGYRLFVSDSSVSTFGSTVAGGGSTKVPIYSDGTNWKVG